ncbi:MAG: TIGR03905 family TSCPD domain-containing protein [Lachnospiraceae bacterium]|nr:TIGR03905 family TSCPD domain-containing protein [Lachnospiraceae bacterium]
MYTYTTKGTCSRQILFDIVDGKVTNVQFVGGCHGNTQGVAALVEGMDAEEVIRRLQKIDCKGRGTSCPDQLARAVRQVLQKQNASEEA